MTDVMRRPPAVVESEFHRFVLFDAPDDTTLPSYIEVLAFCSSYCTVFPITIRCASFVLLSSTHSHTVVFTCRIRFAFFFVFLTIYFIKKEHIPLLFTIPHPYFFTFSASFHIHNKGATMLVYPLCVLFSHISALSLLSFLRSPFLNRVFFNQLSWTII